MKTIDLNCDLGEGGKFDAKLMPMISSCNIACGGHFGNAETVQNAVNLANKYQVNIGAHPSYPDKDNFGRTSLQISKEDLKLSLHQQIDKLNSACKSAKVPLHHIKPHGALYNDMRKDMALADLVLQVVDEREEDLILFIPPGVTFSLQIPKSIQLWTEGFADRAYEDDLSLVSRQEKNAVLHSPTQIADRVLKMIKDNEVIAKSGAKLKQKFNTICVHSDTPDAVEILSHLKSYLLNNQIQIATQNEL